MDRIRGLLPQLSRQLIGDTSQGLASACACGSGRTVRQCALSDGLGQHAS